MPSTQAYPTRQHPKPLQRGITRVSRWASTIYRLFRDRPHRGTTRIRKRTNGDAAKFRARVFACCCAITSVLSSGQARAIDGGTPAGRDQLARATVAVTAFSPANNAAALSRCSGVLIGPDLVLTAAHCVDETVRGAAVVAYNGSEPVRSPFSVAMVSRYSIQSDLGKHAELAAQLAA